MGLLWGPGINIFAFLAAYTYRKYYSYIHAIYGAVSWFMIVVTAIPILITAGIPPPPKDNTESSLEKAKLLNIHFIIGIAAILIGFGQVLIGVFMRYYQMYTTITYSQLTFKKAHIFLGMSLMAVCKINLYIIEKEFYIFLLQDIIFAILFYFRYVKFVKISSTNIASYKEPILKV